jgi:2-isopropylmalate synthase
MGFTLTQEKLTQAFHLFKKLTDTKKQVTDEDIFAILTDIQTDSESIKKYQLVAFQVHYASSTNLPTASVALTTPEGDRIETARTGKGSVEALFNTLEALVEEEIHITNFHLNSIGQGRDALAEAQVKMTVNGAPVNGRSSAQDVLEASAKAFLNAVNRIFLTQRKNEKEKQYL